MFFPTCRSFNLNSHCGTSPFTQDVIGWSNTASIAMKWQEVVDGYGTLHDLPLLKIKPGTIAIYLEKVIC